MQSEQSIHDASTFEWYSKLKAVHNGFIDKLEAALATVFGPIGFETDRLANILCHRDDGHDVVGQLLKYHDFIEFGEMMREKYRENHPVKRVRIMWDIENVPVPKNIGAVRVVQALQEYLALKSYGGCGIQTLTYAFTVDYALKEHGETVLSKQCRLDLHEVRVTIILCKDKREEADKMIVHQINEQKSVLDFLPKEETVFVLITSDKDFTAICQQLFNAGYVVVVVHDAPPHTNHATKMEMYSSEKLLWKDVLDLARQTPAPKDVLDLARQTPAAKDALDLARQTPAPPTNKPNRQKLSQTPCPKKKPKPLPEPSWDKAGLVNWARGNKSNPALTLRIQSNKIDGGWQCSIDVEGLFLADGSGFRKADAETGAAHASLMILQQEGLLKFRNKKMLEKALNKCQNDKRQEDKKKEARREIPCRFFLEGTCTRGDACDFKHGQTAAVAAPDDAAGQTPPLPPYLQHGAGSGSNPAEA